MSDISWEEAVRRFRSNPANAAEVENGYFDLPVTAAAERYFRSEEFSEVSRIFGKCSQQRRVLDFGAGNGIASFALARAGWSVTALEPDSSHEVGAGAIRQLCQAKAVDIRIVEHGTNPLPFADAEFDVIHARQVLHHVPDLRATLRELARVVKRGGAVLATREHVITRDRDRPIFLARHPLHSAFGGENAYRRDEYIEAFESAGLSMLRVFGPTETIINYYPGTEANRLALVSEVGRGLGRYFRRVPGFASLAWRWLSFRDHTPGRLYSFYAVKR